MVRDMYKWLLRAIFLILICLRGAVGQPPPNQQGDGIWVRNAYFGELQTFDKCFGHQPGNGQYHHHVQPICLRAQLKDNVEEVSTSRNGTTYRERTSGWTHSPLLGWSLDGYPIYGPYGYSDPASSSSPVRRIRSGFKLRSITDRSTLPLWSLAHHPGLSQQLQAGQYGPAISEIFPLGRYVEDFDYVEGVGDLDQHNGRFTVTPEFPNGTYAYFATIDEAGAPAFPYIIGLQYYGALNGSNNSAAPTNAQSYFASGAYLQPLSGNPQLASWQTRLSQENAQIVSGFDPSAGAKMTWPFAVPTGAQAVGAVPAPARSDTQAISYTDSAVYVSSNNLASYTMGPWFIDGGNGGVFPNFPSVQNFRVRLPRTPAVASTRSNTGLGPVGMWVNGVAVFNVLDGASYSNAQKADIGGGPVRPGTMHVSSASYEGGPVAPGSLISAFSLFGSKLASWTASSPTPDWPATLGGTTVTVRDSAGSDQAARISFASAGQVNYRLPETVATGLATVTVAANGSSFTGAINIAPYYPNIFKFNAEGLAAGQALRVRNGVQSYEDLYQIVNGSIVARPIDLGPPSDELYLILYGSGLGKSNSAVTVKIGGVDAPVLYAGPQGTYGGLDQYNVRIPPTLAGRGTVPIALTVGDRPANSVNLSIR